MLAKVRRTPLAESPAHLEHAKYLLSKFDLKHDLTERAHAIAQGLLLRTDSPMDDHGRTLEYFAPMHALFTRFAGSPSQKRVLHLGASTGLYTLFLQHNAAVAVPLDIGFPSIKIAKAIGNKLPIRADAQLLTNNPKHLPFADKSFDVFVSDHFLYSNYAYLEDHPAKKPTLGNTVPQSSKLIDEMHRILRNRGIGILHKVLRTELDAATTKARLAGFTILHNEQQPQTRATTTW